MSCEQKFFIFSLFNLVTSVSMLYVTYKIMTNSSESRYVYRNIIAMKDREIRTLESLLKSKDNPA